MTTWRSWACELAGRDDLPDADLRSNIAEELRGLRVMFDRRCFELLAGLATGQPPNLAGLTSTGVAELLAALDELRAALVHAHDDDDRAHDS